MKETLTVLAPLAWEVMAAVLTLAVVLGVPWIRSRRLAMEHKMLLENALTNGVGMFKAYLDPKIDSAPIKLHPDIRSQPMAAAVQYIIDHAGEAVDWFKLPPEHLAEKITARLGVESLVMGETAETRKTADFSH